jgi:hypothetical protein
MPPRSTVTQIRLDNTIACLAIAANTLKTLADNTKTPFLGAMSNTAQSLLKYIQVNVETNLL